MLSSSFTAKRSVDTISWAAWAGVMAKQTRITIETESLLVLRGDSGLRAWCPQCVAETEMIPFEALGVLSNLTPEEVETWLGSEAIHRSRATDGRSFICLNSLLERIRKTRTAAGQP